jgi:hypothetical protein
VVDEAAAQAVESGIVFVDTQRPRAYVLSLDSRSPDARAFALPEGEAQLFAWPGHEGKKLVLTSGAAAFGRGEDIFEEERSHVLVVDAAGVVEDYELPGRFAALSIADDGSHAVAHSPDQAFAVATAVALIDLESGAAADNPRTLSLRSLDGTAPQRFVFTPEAQIAGQKRRLLLSLSDNYLNLVDVDHAERGDVTIELVLPGDGRSVTPEQVELSGDRIFVRSSGTSDVLVIQLTEVALDQNRHGFETSLLTLPVGEPVAGMKLIGEEASCLLSFASGRLIAIDPASGRSQALPVRGDYTSALSYRSRAPNDDDVRGRLLLWGAGSMIAFVDEPTDASLSEASVEEVSVSDDVRELYALSARNLVVLSHGASRVSLVDLAERTVTPLALPGSSERVVVDVARERLWVAFGEGRLGTVSLGPSLETKEILLDAPAENVLIVEGRTPRVAVLHRSESGFVTLLDAEQPSRSSARVLLGFLWAGLLDEEK